MLHGDEYSPSIGAPRVKRTLVLSGGGAKGAYAFGCLKVFREKGIHFDAVSGTSVGALNALLWSTDSLEEGQQIWDELSFATVYPVRLFRNKFLPNFLTNFLGGLFAPLVVGYNLLSSSWTGQPNPVNRYAALILIVLLYLPFIPFLLFVLYLNYDFIRVLFKYEFELGYLLFILLDLIFIVFCLNSLIRLYEEFVQSTTDFSGYFKELAANRFALWPILVLGSGYNYFSLKSFSDFEIAYFIFLIIIPLVISFFLQLFLFSINTINKKVGTVLDATPLHKTLENILTHKGFNLPTVVCTGIAIEKYGKKTWQPEYTEVSELKREETALYCLASAALPFGIVPSVKIGNKEYVDGGIVDNLPFYPFVDELAAEEIFIVALDNFKSKEQAIEELNISSKRWREIVTLQGKYVYPSDRTIPKVKLFYPAESLGDFVKGTLNFNLFDKQYTGKIMKLGYEETIRRLDETN